MVHTQPKFPFFPLIAWLVCSLMVLSCSRITEAPAPAQPSLIQTHEDHYSCTSGVIMPLFPLANDSLVGGFTLTMSNAKHGMVWLKSDTMMYRAPFNFNGTDSITYWLSNANEKKAGLITIQVSYQCITMLNDDNVQFVEGNQINYNILANDTLCGQAFTVNLATGSGLNIRPSTTKGVFSIAAPMGSYGNQSLNYNVNYASGGSYQAKLNVIVLPDTQCAKTLTAVPDSNLYTQVGTPVVIPYNAILQNDVICNRDDVPTANISINTNNPYGTIVPTNGGFVFTPNSNSGGRSAVIPYTIRSKRNQKTSSSFVKIAIH